VCIVGDHESEWFALAGHEGTNADVNDSLMIRDPMPPDKPREELLTA
jgi:hypothetical protein